MKKIISFLFLLQMLIVTFYGMIYLRSSNFYHLLYEGNTLIRLEFEDQIEDYDFFLNLIEEKGLTVSRSVFPDPETILIYTTDVTLGGRISLVEGGFPNIGTSEFISTTITDDEAQVGIIPNLVPGHEIIISDMHHPRNFVLDGFYDINTTNPEYLARIVNALEARFLTVDLYENPDVTPLMRPLRILFSLGFQEGRSLQIQLMEFGIIFSIVTLCIITSSIQYSLNQLKASAIFLTHGYSKSKILSNVTVKLVKMLLLGSVGSFGLMIVYLFSTERVVFLGGMSRLFALFSIVLILFYLGIELIILGIALLKFRVSTVLKGQKFDKSIQIFNHATKGIFTLIFLFIFSLTLTNVQELNGRLMGFSDWEKAQNVHRITISSARWGGGDTAAQRIPFFHDLINYHQGFLMDTTFIQGGDYQREEGSGGGPTGWEPNWLDGSNEIFVSPSFFERNPIYDLEGMLVSERLVLDDYVLNVLLPERFLAGEGELHETFLQMFRGWRSPLDFETMPSGRMRELKIIHVPDEQYYFSFNHSVRQEVGNRVKDPIVIIHQGKFSDMFISSALSHSVFFQGTTHDPFSEIEYLIHKHGLQTDIQRIESVYSQNASEIRALQEHQARLLTLLVLLLIANLSVVYNLVANYFERSKFQIFLKSTFGWSPFKQNKGFLFIYLAYTLPIILVASLQLGGAVLLVGIVSLSLDLVAMIVFQQRLMKKTFSEIMKGER